MCVRGVYIAIREGGEVEARALSDLCARAIGSSVGGGLLGGWGLVFCEF